MWGSAGYGIANFISGVVYDHTDGGYTGIVVVFVVVLAVALVAALVDPVGADDDESVSGGQDGESWYVA